MGLPFESLKGHSFRIGAASAAAAAGLPDWLIKVLGRWSSNCYQLYIRTRKPFYTWLHLRWLLFRITFLQTERNFLFSAWGDAMLCMHLWRLSLRSDFPQACRLRCLYAPPANQYSCPIQHMLSSIQLLVLGR